MNVLLILLVSLMLIDVDAGYASNLMYGSTVDDYYGDIIAQQNGAARMNVNNQLKSPYSIDFGTSQEGWTVIDKSTTPGKSWIFSEKGFYQAGNYYPCVTMDRDYQSEYNDYYVSPGLFLQAGTYIIRTQVAQTSSGASLSLHYGTSATDVSALKKIADLELPDNYVPGQTKENTLTIEADGEYYFAFLGTVPLYNPSTCCLFSFEVSPDGEEPGGETQVTLPYSIDFHQTTEGWTIVDTDGDGSSWVLYAGMGVSAFRMNTGTLDDLISPAFTLEAGKSYAIQTNIAGFMSEENEHLLLMQQKEGENLTELSKLYLKQNGENVTVTMFKPQQTGVYHFSFRNTYSACNNTIQVFSFMIEEKEGAVENEVIYSSDFASNTMEGWTAEDKNTDNITWSTVDGIKGITYSGDAASAGANDWLFSPALPLKGGKDYLVKYTLTQGSAFEADMVDVYYGNEPVSGKMGNKLYSEVISSSDGYKVVSRICRISCATSGDFYLGLHITTPNPNGTFSLSSIEVVSAAGAVPMAVTDFEAVSDNGKKMISFAWMNPILDTDSAMINKPMEARLYADDKLVASVPEMYAGKKGSYDYYPETFGGVVVYKLSLAIGEKESEAVTATVNMDDIQGDSILLQQFTMESRDLFKQWKVENVNGKDTWEYDYKSASIFYGNHDDWLISPEIPLKASERYIIQYEAKSTLGYSADFDLTIGNQQTADAQTTVLDSHMGLEQNGFGEFVTKQFSVPADGTYYIAFHAKNVKNVLAVRNIRICYIGKGATLMPLPYTQNFDSDVNFSDSWFATNTTGGEKPSVIHFSNEQTDGYAPHSYPNAVGLSKNTGYQEDYLFTPKFALTQGVDYEINFWAQMPGLGEGQQVLSLYMGANQKVDGIPATPLATFNSAILKWEKQRVVFTPERSGEYVFAFKIVSYQSSDKNTLLDDFSISEAVSLVSPGAPANLLGEVDGISKVNLFWNNPYLDVDGNKLASNTRVKTRLYEGDQFLGETEGKIMELMQFSYEYTDKAQYAGQKIYKAVSYIEDIQGEANTALVTISSFEDGMLTKQYADFIFDKADGWAIVDGDNDSNQWTVDSTEKLAQTTGSDDWIISPEFELEKGKLYYISCEVETNVHEGADLTFTLGNSQEIENHWNIAEYKKLTLGLFDILEVGQPFIADKTRYAVGIHVTNNTGTVKVKGLKVTSIFREEEPEVIPYTEDFEDLSNWNDSALFINKWGRYSSTNTTDLRFLVCNASEEYNIAAHSGSYAAVAAECTWGERYEALYTPMFDLKQGKVYEISYYLYMPGNNGVNTAAGIFASPTRDGKDMEELLLQEINEPVKEWTKFTFKYEATADGPRCFFFNFIATEKCAGIIAFDDFSIKEIQGDGIEEQTSGTYFINETSTLVVPQESVRISVYDIQGRLVMEQAVRSGQVDLSVLSEGFYTVRIENSNGQFRNIKIMR